MAFVAEGVLWPAERRLQVAVGRWMRAHIRRADGTERDATAMVRAAAAALVLLVVGLVIMVGQP